MAAVPAFGGPQPQPQRLPQQQPPAGNQQAPAAGGAALPASGQTAQATPTGPSAAITFKQSQTGVLYSDTKMQQLRSICRTSPGTATSPLSSRVITWIAADGSIYNYRVRLFENGKNDPLTITSEGWDAFNERFQETLVVAHGANEAFKAGIAKFQIATDPTTGLKINYAEKTDEPPKEITSWGGDPELRVNQARCLDQIYEALQPQPLTAVASSADDDLPVDSKFQSRLSAACQNLESGNALDSQNLVFAARALTAHKDNCVMIFDQTGQTLGSSSQTTHQEIGRQITEAATSSNDSKYLFIPYFEGGHYTLLYREPVVASGGKWYHYNSRRTDPTNPLPDKLQQAITSANIHLEPLTVPQGAEKQTDDISCGVFVLRKIDTLLHASNQTNDTDQIVDYRRKFATFIKDAFSPEKLLEKTKAIQGLQEPTFVATPDQIEPNDQLAIAPSTAKIAIYDGSVADLLPHATIVGKPTVCSWTRGDASDQELQYCSSLARVNDGLQSKKNQTAEDTLLLRAGSQHFYRELPSGDRKPFKILAIDSEDAQLTAANFEHDQLKEEQKQAVRKKIYQILSIGTPNNTNIIIPPYPMEGLTPDQRFIVHQYIAQTFKQLLTTRFAAYNGTISFAMPFESGSDAQKDRQAAYYSAFRQDAGHDIDLQALPVASIEELSPDYSPIDGKKVERPQP